jgi:hypothetical protein
VVHTVADLLAQLRIDPWREEVGFSPEVETCQRILFDRNKTEGEWESALSAWLQKYQPCLFGRIAAKLSLISFCFLTEADLYGSDEGIREKIQAARKEWTKQGFEGRKSAFVILAISEKIARSIPDQTALLLACQLCSLYLLQEVESNQICLDEIFLEIPGYERATWRWNVGSNYFCANGDRRWWQDHRIPGGMGFSMNSVGHMVKSGTVAGKLNELHKVLEMNEDELVTTKVDSLEKALEMAMRTIWLASDAASGKATWLLPRPANRNAAPTMKCPVDLPGFLADKDFCEYAGYYHTDYTIPTEYFVPDVKRRDDQVTFPLDFTYLFYDAVENPAHQTIGRGRRIRAFPTPADIPQKYDRGMPEQIQIQDSRRLKEALE